MSDQERRARLAVRHCLAPGARAGSPVEAARSLVGLHATDPATVFLSAWARTQETSVAAVERALYEERSLIRMLGMRRTVFVEPVELVPVVQAACARAIAERERRRLVQMLEAGGVARDGAAWLSAVERETVAALEAAGSATAAQLAQQVPGLREGLHVGEGTRWAGRQGVSTRVLFLLGCEGRIVRGRPRGSWTSTQYVWWPAGAWLPGGIPVLDEDAAAAALARAWLAAFGPAPADDLRWWAGWTAGKTRRALAALHVVDVDAGGAACLVLAGDENPTPAPEPWAALLPALDPTVMGWARRDWYLGGHGHALFDRSGNAGPTVWWDGRVVGGWAQRPGGEVAVRLLEDPGVDARAAVGACAERVEAWLAGAHVTPRFRTPLERELVHGGTMVPPKAPSSSAGGES